MPTELRPLKILHVLDHSLPLHSGYAFRSESIFHAQRDKEWSPVVLTSSKHEANWAGPWQGVEDIHGIRYYRTGALQPSSLPLVPEGRLMSALARRLRQVIDLEKPDILHAHSPVLNALPTLWVGRRLGLPVVYEIRAFWEDAAVDHATYRQNGWQYTLVKALETWVCQRTTQVTVLCRGIQEDLQKRGVPAEKLTIVYNGVNTEDFRQGEPDEAFRQRWGLGGKTVIGFIGSFYRYEGLDLLIQAIANLKKSRSDVVLLLVGGGDVEASLKAQKQALGVDNEVIMPGKIPHERIPGIYALVDILAYPRYDSRLTDLVTPLKPLEAMAMGKALVASDVGGHRELIQHRQTGVLFSADSVTALTEALDGLLADPALRERIGRQGMAWVREEHPWAKTTAVYTQVYAKALEGCPGVKNKVTLTTVRP